MEKIFIVKTKDNSYGIATIIIEKPDYYTVKFADNVSKIYEKSELEFIHSDK